MKVLSIYGSPHEKGFTSQLHELFCESIKQKHTVIKSYDISIEPCIACHSCEDKASCIYDDMDEIYDALRESSHIIISSPLYFSSVTSMLKKIIDRCQVIWEEERRGELSDIKRKAIFISTGGSDYKNMFLGAELPVRHLFATLHGEYNKDDFIYLSGCDDLTSLPSEIISKTKIISEKFFKL